MNLRELDRHQIYSLELLELNARVGLIFVIQFWVLATIGVKFVAENFFLFLIKRTIQLLLRQQIVIHGFVVEHVDKAKFRVPM